MSEQRSSHPHLEQHPNAIQNVKKAHHMALATDYQETAAAGLRYAGTEALSNGRELPIDYEEAVLEVEMPEHYKESLEVLEGRVTVDGLVEEIKGLQKHADQQSKFVGKAYDKFKATKR